MVNLNENKMYKSLSEKIAWEKLCELCTKYHLLDINENTFYTPIVEILSNGETIIVLEDIGCTFEQHLNQNLVLCCDGIFLNDSSGKKFEFEFVKIMEQNELV